MSFYPTSLNRRLMPWILGTTLVILAGIATTRILSLQDELREQLSARLEEQLQDRIGAWEDNFVSLLNEWMDQFGSGQSDLHKRQLQLRSRSNWFDSLYLWQLPKTSHDFSVPDEGPTEVFFPRASISNEMTWVRAHPCIRHPKLMGAASRLSFQAIASEILKNCEQETSSVKIVAAIEAAALYDQNGQSPMALELLSQAGYPPELHLQSLMNKGISPFRAVSVREFQSVLMRKVGQTEKALDLLYRTGLQISELNAPDANTTVQYLSMITAALDTYGRKTEVARLRMAMDQTNRRIRGWEEVSNRIIPESGKLVGKPPRFVFDQYRDTPYLIYYGANRNTLQGVALQMDQSLVLSHFMKANRRYGKGIVVTDAGGNWVAGAKASPEEIDVQVSFGKTLTHLTVGLSKEFTERRMSELSDQWLVPLFVTGFCVILGFLALVAQVSANRRLQDLMVRQREFTTRVTHELKTPIAGIRIMAENLETGIYTTESQQKKTARQIIAEADRLTLRVEEVLALTRKPTIQRPEPFDIEEVCFDIIALWGPRLERQNVHFSAEIEVGPEIIGDANEVHDAIGCLLDNALKYRDESQESCWVTLRLTTVSGFAHIEVCDNGLGVPEIMRTRVFERFQRVEGPNRGKAGGHGLGLAQVAAVARLHQGTIMCYEHEGKGSRFVFRIKARK